MLKYQHTAGPRVDVQPARLVSAVESCGAAFDEELWERSRFFRGGRGRGGGVGTHRVVQVEVKRVEGAFAAVGGDVGAVAVFWEVLSGCFSWRVSGIESRCDWQRKDCSRAGGGG